MARASRTRAPGETEPGPYIPASTVLPELTIKVFVIGILLSWVMAAANAYLGLFAALTVSAAIPASVISMAVLRFFRRRNILENNLIQTAASAGESVAGGIIFTLPALLILGTWKQIGIIETMLIAGIGGSLGVFFTIPLRRAFIVDAKLQYPEGVATVEVLKSGEKGGSGVGYIVVAGILGAVYKFMGAGMLLWNEAADYARRIGSSGFYFGATLSPALLSVGFIVGLPIATLIFGGGVISYGIAIPIYLATHPWPTGAFGQPLDAISAFGAIRGTYIRFIGVGAMATGGIYTLIKLRGALVRGFRSGLEAYQALKTQGTDTRIRTERDLNMRNVLIGIGLFAIPLIALFSWIVTEHFSHMERVWIGVLLGIVMLFAGFLFSAVTGYMAGLVGSSNNPISGTAIGTILLTATLLFALGVPGSVGAAATILIGSTIACAAAIAGDNMQDLKAGHLLGGTPRNLQIMQIVGALAGAVALPSILMLLHSAYGIGVPPARCDPTSSSFNPAAVCDHVLAAPQANLMANIANGIFHIGQPIPWAFVWIGVAIAAAIILLDKVLEWRNIPFRTPVMAVAVGIYLPFDLTTPIFLGGLVAFAARRWVLRRHAQAHPDTPKVQRTAFADHRVNRGVLFASGLIAGESLTGLVIGGVIVGANGVNILGVFSNPTWYWPGLVLLLYLAFLIGYSVTRGGPSEQSHAAPGDERPRHKVQ